MSPTLAPEAGALRARLDEGDWAAAVAHTDLVPASLLVAPLVAATPRRPDPAIVEAATLAAQGGVRVEVRSWLGDSGLVGLLGSDRQTAAGVARVTRRDAGGWSAVPGVEVSAYPAASMLAELMRLVPPDLAVAAGDAERRDGPAGQRGQVAVPVEAALLLDRADQTDDAAAQREVAAMLGWDGVPDLLDQLTQVRGGLTVGVHSRGSDQVDVRHWLAIESGWVAVWLDGDQVLHEPRSRDRLADDLLYVVAGVL